MSQPLTTPPANLLQPVDNKWKSVSIEFFICLLCVSTVGVLQLLEL